MWTDGWVPDRTATGPGGLAGHMADGGRTDRMLGFAGCSGEA
jgi:hypothetical protein